MYFRWPLLPVNKKKHRKFSVHLYDSNEQPKDYNTQDEQSRWGLCTETMGHCWQKPETSMGNTRIPVKWQIPKSTRQPINVAPLKLQQFFCIEMENESSKSYGDARAQNNQNKSIKEQCWKTCTCQPHNCYQDTTMGIVVLDYIQIQRRAGYLWTNDFQPSQQSHVKEQMYSKYRNTYH